MRRSLLLLTVGAVESSWAAVSMRPSTLRPPQFKKRCSRIACDETEYFGGKSEEYFDSKIPIMWRSYPTSCGPPQHSTRAPPPPPPPVLVRSSLILAGRIAGAAAAPLVLPLDELESRFRLPQRYYTKDWLSILLQTPRSRVLRRISHPMLVCVVWTCYVLCCSRLHEWS